MAWAESTCARCLGKVCLKGWGGGVVSARVIGAVQVAANQGSKSRFFNEANYDGLHPKSRQIQILNTWAPTTTTQTHLTYTVHTHLTYTVHPHLTYTVHTHALGQNQI